MFLFWWHCAENIQTVLGKHHKFFPDSHVLSADTLLCGVKENATDNSIYNSKQGNRYDFILTSQLCFALLTKHQKLSKAF